MDIEATKFYVRHRERYPETEVHAYAAQGFWSFGVEVAPFYWKDDITELKDLGPTVGISGYVDDVAIGLRTLGKEVPRNHDYPAVLSEFLGRAIRPGTLEDVRRRPGYPAFIKPLYTHKLFTGFVWEGDSLSRQRIVTCSDDLEIWISEPVKFVSEYRAFILDGEIQGVRLYKGAWALAPDREVVEGAVAAMEGIGPRAFSLDFGVTVFGRQTLLIEYNDAYALGHYGLTPTTYARMLSARWHEMVTVGPKNFDQIYQEKLSDPSPQENAQSHTSHFECGASIEEALGEKNPT